MLRIAGLAYLVWLGGLYFFQGRLLFPASIARATAQKPDEVEVWTLPTLDGGKVEAWYWPAKSSTATSVGTAAETGARLAPAVIFCHGNAELVDNGLGQAELYRDMGFAVLLPEYRGYGQSSGRPSQASITEDLIAFHDRLAGTAGVDPRRIVYHGRSIGGGFACALAAERRPAALVLESTFTSVASFTWGFGVPPVLCRNPLRSDRVVGKLDCPILLLHGRADTLVPCSHSEKLARLSRHATLALGAGGHNDFPQDWRWYESAIRSFVREIAADQP